jgi:hypothetical protein
MIDVFSGACIETSPLRSILRGLLVARFARLSRTVGGETGRCRVKGRSSLVESCFGVTSCGSSAVLRGVDAASESNCVMSRPCSKLIALPSRSWSRLITPRVQCNTPTGRIARRGIRVTPFSLILSCGSSEATSSRKDAMLASSWGFDVAVINCRHKKCVNGGFFAAGGFRGCGIFYLGLVV